MTKLVSLVVLVAFVGMVAGITLGEDAPANVTVKGTFVKASADNAKVIVVKVTREMKDVEIKITTDDKTTVTIDGKDGKLADLKAGMNLEITKPKGMDTVASKIVATTAIASAPAAGAAPAK